MQKNREEIGSAEVKKKNHLAETGLGVLICLN